MDLEIEETTPTKAPEASGLPQLRSAKLPSAAGPLPGNDKRRIWQSLRLLSRLGLYVGLALFVSGKYVIAKFDDKLSIEKSVRRDPIQTPIRKTPFTFEYRGHSYQIEPVADYDISGLIVTHNDISSVFDAYHSKDSVDFRDICLVWGANVGSGIFRRFKFWSMPWSCHFHTDDRNALDSFVETQISNNHILSADENVQRIVRSMKIGDQIRLQGMLINYWPVGASELERRTSTTREDTGNGACEVLWVERAEIDRKSVV